jgi:hypothetical protein
LKDEAKVLAEERLRFLRLFLSVERQSDRDQIFQMVNMFVSMLKNQK